MNKLVKRLLTGTLAFATILTALPVTAVHASGNQYWTESAERVGYIEQIMNDGSIKSTFHGIIGLLFSVFFIWIIINGANTFQKKVINIVHSKMDNKLTSGKREYCFDTDGITVSSDIGNGTNHWNAFKCWGIFRNYIYVRTIKNEMILVNQNDLSESDVKELKSLLSQNLKEETL